MTRKQRAAPQSAPPKGQTAPPARQHSCEARREHGRGETEDGAGLRRPTHPQVRPAPHGGWKRRRREFSEVVRRAHDQGPQYVTVRGKQAVAIIDAAELERLLPASPEVVPLVQFLESLHIEGLDLTRERDLGREPSL